MVSAGGNVGETGKLRTSQSTPGTTHSPIPAPERHDHGPRYRTGKENRREETQEAHKRLAFELLAPFRGHFIVFIVFHSAGFFVRAAFFPPTV